VGDQISQAPASTFAIVQPVLSGSLGNQLAMNRRLPAGHNQTAVRRSCESGDAVLDFAGVPRVDWNDLDSERRRHGLKDGKLPDPGRDGRVANDGGAGDTRGDLLKQFQPFPGYAEFKLHEARDVATRPRQACDDAGPDRIDNHREHDGDGAGGALQCCRGRPGGSEDHIGRERDQFGRVLAISLGIALCAPAHVNADIAAVGPAQLL
jgi:hypothetical protein